MAPHYTPHMEAASTDQRDGHNANSHAGTHAANSHSNGASNGTSNSTSNSASNGKLHAACDECRKRKLKCSGEPSGCSRCRTERLECVYSATKQMGRPRKRKLDEVGSESPTRGARQAGRPGREYSAHDYNNWRNLDGLGNVVERETEELEHEWELAEEAARGCTAARPDTPPTYSHQHQHSHQLSRSHSHSHSHNSDHQTSYVPSFYADTVTTAASSSGVSAHTADSSNTSYSADGLLTPTLSLTWEAVPHVASLDMSAPACDTRLPPETVASATVVKPAASEAVPTCACLANMYLSTTDLQSGPRAFPMHLKPLRGAIGTINALLRCAVCPKKKLTASQNIMFVTSLLQEAGEHVGILLNSIDEERRRAEAAGTKKSLCLGDADPENFHLHTHGPDCPARFTVKLDPADWGRLARRTVLQEVREDPDELPGARLTLTGLLDNLVARQNAWHTICESRESELPHMPKVPGDYTCLRLLGHARNVIDRLPQS